MTKKGIKVFSNTGLSLQAINPLTVNQEKVFEATEHLVLQGCAGTGKTFLALYLAMQGISERQYTRTVLIRNVVPTRDMGFLPGSESDKVSVYEDPYKAISTELFGRGDAYGTLKKHGLIQFVTTSFIRGITFRDSVIIVDECQNMTFHELDSIITRVGHNCRIIFCGDFEQKDHIKGESKSLPYSDLGQFLKILKATHEFDTVNFSIDDIVRSGLVKKYLIAKHKILK